MHLSSVFLFATSAILLCVEQAQGFLPAPPTITSSSPASASSSTKALPAPVSSAPAATASATVLNAVLNGGDLVDSDKPKLKLPNTCDSDYDCDGSEFCCEFMFFKMCCSDGWRAENDWVPVPIPVPIPVDDYYGRGGYGGYR